MMKKTILLIGFVCFLASCGNQKSTNSQETTTAPTDEKPLYNLSKAESFPMPDELKEISGISFAKDNNRIIYAEQDEKGKLFAINLTNKAINAVNFGKKGDYEDVSILNETVVLLKSDGTLLTFPLKEFQENNIGKVNEWENLVPKGEYEAMYADNATNLIYVLCKNCEDDNQKKALKGYIIAAENGKLTNKNSFEIEVKAIKKLANAEKIKFKPSALAKNPRTNDWYIVSAINEIMVVTTANFQPKYVYALPKNIFNQPEGIAFDNENNLYISNEGNDFWAGNILKFTFTP